MPSLHFIEVTLLFLTFKFHSCLCQTNATLSGSGTGNDVNCPSGSVRCFVGCDGSNSGTKCGDINCPSSDGCKLCEITCTGNNGCRNIDVEGYNCESVEVIIDSGSTAARDITINAPGNGGSLQVTQTTDVDNQALYDGTIISKNGTDSISVICETSAAGYQCERLTIYGQYANSVNLECNQGSTCDDVFVHCPDRSDTEFPTCNLICDNANCGVTLNITDNSWKDNAHVECTPNLACQDITLRCGNGDCEFDNNGTICRSTGSPTDCQPTEMPTMVPSGFPTNNPSRIPSKMPSSIPTSNPTNNPSMIPTNKPSLQPSRLPSRLPSSEPNDMTTTADSNNEPTSSPAIGPTDIPTSAPSDDGNTGAQTTSGGNDDTGLIIGIVAGILVVLIIGIVIIIWCLNKQKNDSEQDSIAIGQVQSNSVGNNTNTNNNYNGNEGNGKRGDLEMEHTDANKLRTESDVVHTEEKDIEYVTRGGDETDNTLINNTIANASVNSNSYNNNNVASPASKSTNPLLKNEYGTGMLIPNSTGGLGFNPAVAFPAGMAGTETNANNNPGDGNGNDNGNGDDSDTSQSSEAEMEEIRNKVAINAVLNEVTPGGPEAEPNNGQIADGQNENGEGGGQNDNAHDSDDDIMDEMNDEILNNEHITPGMS